LYPIEKRGDVVERRIPFFIVEVNVPAVSKKQQQATGAALAAKRGKMPMSKLKGASKQMTKMSEKQLEEYAGTKRKGLPAKKKKGKK